MENNPLTSAEKKELRGIGQRLKPHLHIGKQGLGINVFKEIDRALIKNGLIKIRFEAEREAIQSYCNDIPDKLNCECRAGRKDGYFLPRHARKSLALSG